MVMELVRRHGMAVAVGCLEGGRGGLGRGGGMLNRSVGIRVYVWYIDGHGCVRDVVCVCVCVCVCVYLCVCVCLGRREGLCSALPCIPRALSPARARALSFSSSLSLSLSLTLSLSLHV